MCAQGLAKGAHAVEYVGGSSSVVAVGGRGAPGEGHIALWDTLAPPSSAGVGRLGQHQASGWEQGEQGELESVGGGAKT